jgi:HEAT repeat protein
MKLGALLRMLNVYPNEWGLVKRLYIFQFFQGAGLAFFFTAAFALFLEKMPIIELSWVLIYSSILLWIAGFLYSRLEHALSFSNFNAIITAGIVVSILLLGISTYLVTENWFYYWLLAWFNVLYLLNNLQFWGIATLFFDLRQSKRLFAVISAGDIPAKFFGYTLALIIVPYTGTRILLFVGAVCILASIPFLRSIIKLAETKVIHLSDHAVKEKQSRKQIGKLVKNLATNLFIRRIAFISLVSSACIILINYGFYAEVRKAYQDDVELARFIAFFFAILRVIALITKMLFTSRVTASIGIRPSLFITPLGMLLLTVAIIAVEWISPDKKLIFYLFAIASIIVDVLRSSFNSPVLLTLMQPLSTHERLRAHNIVKGFMDPFASLFCGVLLFTSFTIQGRVDLMFLCYILLALGVLWLIGVVLVNRQYLDVLIKTISTRYFSQEEFNLQDETITQHIRQKMENGSEAEVISILRMLISKKNPVAEDLILHLLSHPSDQVKLETLRLIDNRYVNIKQKLQSILSSDVNPEVKNETVKTLCKIAGNNEELMNYLNDSNEVMRKAAITGMFDNNDIKVRKMAEDAVIKMLSLKDNENKQKVILILNEVKQKFSHPILADLINDEDPAIQKMAIKAVGDSCSTEVLTALLHNISSHEKLVLQSLYNVGEAAIPRVYEQILSPQVNESLKEKLIALCGRIGGKTSEHVLVDLLKKQPQQVAAVVKALHRCKYVADETTHRQLENIARMHIMYGVELLYMRQTLSRKVKGYEALDSSLNQEVQEIREILLCLFECMYDREKINEAKYGLDAKDKESIANAMEIIELTVKKDLAKNFNVLFDNTALDQRCSALRALFTEKQFVQLESVLARILSEKPITYQNWTKACSLYFSKKLFHQLDARLYEKYIHSDNLLLKETALFASTTS